MRRVRPSIHVALPAAFLGLLAAGCGDGNPANRQDAAIDAPTTGDGPVDGPLDGPSRPSCDLSNIKIVPPGGSVTDSNLAATLTQADQRASCLTAQGGPPSGFGQDVYKLV